MIKGKASFWGLLHFIICRHIPSRNQLADRIAHGREFLLIFCHYISFVHGVVMEVKGVRLDLPSGLRDGFQRIVKQSPVVGFKLNYSVFARIWSYTAIKSGEVSRRLAWRSLGQGSEKFK